MWNYDQLCDIYYYGIYHPYRLNGTSNPLFDKAYSGKILDLKEGKTDVLPMFKQILAELINSFDKPVAIVLVPSHENNKWSNLSIILAELCNGVDVINKTESLVRNKTIAKLASGGDRSILTHINSINVDNLNLQNMHVLLIDDISTTGNSLKACKKIILDNCPDVLSVNCCVFGKTG